MRDRFVWAAARWTAILCTLPLPLAAAAAQPEGRAAASQPVLAKPPTPIAKPAPRPAVVPASAAASAASAAAAPGRKGGSNARADELEQLGVLDLQIDMARRRAELQRALEQATPNYQLPAYGAIYGAEGHLRAVLVSPNGARLTVGEGDRVARGITVSAVTPSGVEVAVTQGKGLRKIALDPAAPQDGSSQGSVIPTPGVPLPTGPLPALPAR